MSDLERLVAPVGKLRKSWNAGGERELLKFDDGVTDSGAGLRLGQLSSGDLLPHRPHLG